MTSSVNITEISSIIQEKINQYDIKPIKHNQGKIVSIKDGIVQIYGINQTMSSELLDFGNKCFGIALNLEKNLVGAVVLGPYEHLREGQIVHTTGQIIQVPVGDELLGRVVNALGVPVDGKGEIKTTLTRPIEEIAPDVISRKSIDQPLQTGIIALDTMVPIGKGQRELIIGDRQTGKTSIAIDTIINQKNTGVKCIYVAIGQRKSSVAQIVKKLADNDSLEHTIIVVASASDTASLQYIAPYSGCSMGEYFRDKGEDALIIYDDLSKHAVAYRQISLLLRRPPGREAFPGDIFYLHSRLLERASRINEESVKELTKGKVENKTGSLTALPIVETQAGDVSSFIPTNVISITDGQIFLESNLFNAGIKPAINSGLSVSRVGGAAQTSIIKKLGSKVRITLAQFRELEAFSQFASDLDKVTQKQLQKGKQVTELLKQDLFNPLSVGEMAFILLLAESNHLDNVDIGKIKSFILDILNYIKNNEKGFIDEINKNPVLNDYIISKCSQIIVDFKNLNTEY